MLQGECVYDKDYRHTKHEAYYGGCKESVFMTRTIDILNTKPIMEIVERVYL